MSDNEKMESMDDYLDELEKSFHRLKNGDMVKGPVIGIGETEVTVDLGSYAEGIVPIDELSNDPKFSIKTDIAVGDIVNAMVISPDNGIGQVLLSIKRADNILAWDFLGLALDYVEDTESFVGKHISVRIIEVDEDDRKLILSAKSVLREEEAKKTEEKMSKIAIGTVVTGKVERIENYGAFVRLPDGLSGLVHISQMSERRIKHPKEVVSENDEVKVMITDIKDGKLSFSMTRAAESEATDDTDSTPVEYSTGDSPTTSFADLLKGIKL